MLTALKWQYPHQDPVQNIRPSNRVTHYTFAVDPNSGAKSFFTAYNNPTVVKDTHQAEQTLATSARQSLYNYIQAQSASDAFMAYLYYSPYAYATTSSVHGFFVTPLGNYHLENVSLSK